MENTNQVKGKFSYKMKISKEKMILIVLTAALVIVFAALMSLLLQLNLVENLVMGWVLTTFYAIFGFFVVDHTTLVQPERTIFRNIERPVVIEKPVIQEVPVQIPVENTIVEVVEKPVIKFIETIKEVEKPVYITREVEKIRPVKPKLHIPKYDFLGSTETKTYHKRNCRFSKLIKKKYRVSNNKAQFFKKKHFKQCKVCMKRLNKKK